MNCLTALLSFFLPSFLSLASLLSIDKKGEEEGNFLRVRSRDLKETRHFCNFNFVRHSSTLNNWFVDVNDNRLNHGDDLRDVYR